MVVVGRAEELRTLQVAVDAARGGQSAVWVVTGGPGMGKSALMAAVVESVDGFTVHHVSGIESEMELAYAGLHRLLRPFLGSRGLLPPPQRDALGRIFGLTDGPPPDRFIVGLATLSLLGLEASTKPLLCVIDDAHWLDTESREAMMLAARRFGADRIVMLFGARDLPGRSSFEGVPVLRLGSLPADDAATLVRAVASGPLDQHTVERIVAETEACPLAIVELAAEVSAAQLSALAAVPAPLPLSKRLEAHFSSQIEVLPTATQQFLLVAAADPSADAAVVVAAAASLGLPADAADAAVAAGLLMLEPSVEFRHPLVRSAVYSGAAPASRRRVHTALAAVTPDREGDQRAWHRAAAVTTADEAIAADLEHSAHRARARGGLTAAGVFLARSADLTPDPARRAERVLNAAGSFVVGGAPLRARSLLDSSAALLADERHVTDARYLGAVVHYAAGEFRPAIAAFIDVARRLSRHDPRRARSALLHAVAAVRFAGRFTTWGEREVEIATLVRETPAPTGAPLDAADALLDGYASLHLEGPDRAVPILRQALQRLQADDSTGSESLLPLGIGCWVAGAIVDDEALHALAARMVEQARGERAIVDLSSGLLYLAMSELLHGAIDRARSHFAERSELVAMLGRPVDIGQVVVHAWAGHETEARIAADAVVAYAHEHQHGWMLTFVEYALTLLELGLANYQAAFETTTKNYGHDSFLGVVGYPNMIEAAVRSGHPDFAAQAFAVYSASSITMGTPISLGLRARTAALLAPDHQVEDLHREAIRWLTRSSAELQLARAHLNYGEWLRRQHRRLDAREQLRTAHTIFTTRGIDAFAERTRRELVATGVRVEQNSPAPVHQLTAQEREIAELAAQGATNSEIAAKLYLSANTIDYHLRKIYRKLSVSSRRQLGRALGPAQLPGGT